MWLKHVCVLLLPDERAATLINQPCRNHLVTTIGHITRVGPVMVKCESAIEWATCFLQEENNLL